MKASSESLKEWVRSVEDPELQISLVDLGLIYSVEETAEKSWHLRMTLTSPGCPVAPMIIDQVKKRLEEHPDVDSAEVELVWEPKWDPKTMATDDGKEKMGIW